MAGAGDKTAGFIAMRLLLRFVRLLRPPPEVRRMLSVKQGAPVMGLGVPELVVIFLIVVVLFGASRLPQLGRGLGEGISNFKRGLKSSEAELEGDADDQETEKNSAK